MFSTIARAMFADASADDVQVFGWESVLLSLLPYVKFSFCSYESLASRMDSLTYRIETLLDVDVQVFGWDSVLLILLNDVR